ncbi:PucR family transcriptional regulator [Paenibacillus crassostreae]|uniref:PucR family transcriptional regulator n=1 Tax=Paenibacillus crassostreae TaxID=1763538 RepID=A0A167DTS3_9BACL|nr:PucR family transcriptional regulator [Paenibacillus crassostreae]AOZ91073.1 hypothetical protein LPB68_01875 [Paenibacillus crassostreae]OAB74766.1 hypothetical protein PNBC_12080 [Paenibacillus crassostreae]
MSSQSSSFGMIRTISCHDLFNMTALPKLKLLAGERKLSNIISRVNIMEVPDIQNWVQHNEFLITTGFSYQNNLDEFLTLIPYLVEKGVSAFAIKPKRFITEIPQSVIDCAEHYGLPLFELAEDTVFSNVVREVMEKVVSSETEHIMKLQDRLALVSNLMIQDHSISTLIEKIEKLIGNPLAVVDSRGQLITGKQNGQLFEFYYEQLLLKDTTLLMNLQKSCLDLIDMNGEQINIHVFNLWDSEKEPLRTIVLEANNICDELDSATVSHIQPYLNIRVRSEVTYLQVKNKYFDDFLQDWLNGHIKSLEELNVKGELYQLEDLASQHYQIAIVNFYSSLSARPDYSTLGALNKHEYESRFMFTIKEGKLIVIIPSEQDCEQATEQSLILLRKLLEKVLQTKQFSLCVGEIFPPIKLPDALEDVERLYVATNACCEKSDNVTWDKLGIYSVLTLLPAHKNIDKFLVQFIQPIIDYDQLHHSNLLHTLKSYFLMGCNIKSTAQHMFTHYNTVVYRLDKIKAILDISFDDSEIQLKLLLALKLYEMSQTI